MATAIRREGQPPHKLAKLDAVQPSSANVIVQFQSESGEPVGERRPSPEY